jgi:hypothetical protein
MDDNNLLGILEKCLCANALPNMTKQAISNTPSAPVIHTKMCLSNTNTCIKLCFKLGNTALETCGMFKIFLMKIPYREQNARCFSQFKSGETPYKVCKHSGDPHIKYFFTVSALFISTLFPQDKWITRVATRRHCNDSGSPATQYIWNN